MGAISSPEDLCNEALRALGFARMIGDIYEGSPQSRACLELYGQTRDEILRQRLADSFATGNASLTLLKGPPPDGGFNPMTPWSTTYAPPGWLYEYAYPADMIDLRALVPPPGPMPDLDPKPAVWRIDNDNSLAPAARVILANIGNAIAIYRRRVTDLTLWQPMALAAFITLLAKKLAASPRLASSPEFIKMLPAEVGVVAANAAGARG